MRITLRRTWGSVPEVHELAWPAVREWFHAHATQVFHPNPDRKKKPTDLPLITFGAFDVPSPDGSISYKRENLNPCGLGALALDFDDTPSADFQRITERVKRTNPLGGIIHTTWKHGMGPLGTVRARLIVNTGLVPLAHWPVFWASCVEHVGADVEGLDRACSNPERTYYLPATNPEAPWPCWVDSW